MVYVSNALDHVVHPVRGLKMLLWVLHPDGQLLLRHFRTLRDRPSQQFRHVLSVLACMCGAWRNVHPERWSTLSDGQHQWGFDVEAGPGGSWRNGARASTSRTEHHIKATVMTWAEDPGASLFGIICIAGCWDLQAGSNHATAVFNQRWRTDSAVEAQGVAHPRNISQVLGEDGAIVSAAFREPFVLCLQQCSRNQRTAARPIVVTSHVSEVEVKVQKTSSFRHSMTDT